MLLTRKTPAGKSLAMRGHGGETDTRVLYIQGFFHSVYLGYGHMSCLGFLCIYDTFPMVKNCAVKINPVVFTITYWQPITCKKM